MTDGKERERSGNVNALCRPSGQISLHLQTDLPFVKVGQKFDPLLVADA